MRIHPKVIYVTECALGCNKLVGDRLTVIVVVLDDL